MNYQNGFTAKGVLVLLALLVAGGGYFSLRDKTPTRESELLQVCPNEKIINKMPAPIPNNNPSGTYFILDGQRRELDEFDLEWVEKNCTVEEQVVY